MTTINIRKTEALDYPKIIQLNENAVQHTSIMDLNRLAELDALSNYHKVIVVDDVVAGFLLAMRENAAYANENFSFFSSKYDTFLYIDRIVIDAEYAGLKLGTLLYNDLFDYARNNGVSVLTCEYNIEPPNEPSRRFHDKYGFKEIGTQWLDAGKKRVSLQAAVLE